MIDVRIQSADFDPCKQLARLEELGAPGIASFTALVQASGDVRRIDVDHYAAMAKSELGKIAREAEARWPLLALIVIHRYGQLEPGERLAFVGAGATDSAVAVEACGYVVAQLDSRAPFWRELVLDRPALAAPRGRRPKLGSVPAARRRSAAPRPKA